MSARRAPRFGAAVLLAAAMVSGCGPAASTGPASFLPASQAAGSVEADLAAIEGQVEAIRGLNAGTPVTPVLLDSADLAARLAAIDSAQTDHVALADESRLFIHLGLLPAGSSLEQMELALDSGQVVGFYDPDSKGLYVLSASRSLGPVEKITFAHEFTHALQDQNFGLEKLATDTPDQGDRDLARTSLPEGDATLSMTLWSERNLSPLELLEVAAQSLDPSQEEQLADAPAILRQDLTFPYTQGLAFVQSAYAAGGWPAVDAIYARPPDSTAQILHPELYRSDVEPVAVTVPPVPKSLGSGWQVTIQDTLGEFQLGVWLAGEAPTDAQNTAATAAISGWTGDRVALYEGPGDAWAVVLRTAMTDDGSVAAFQGAASGRAATLAGYAVACGEPGFVDILAGSSESVVNSFGICPPPV